jgi:hypothetical protein
VKIWLRCGLLAVLVVAIAQLGVMEYALFNAVAHASAHRHRGLRRRHFH